MVTATCTEWLRLPLTACTLTFPVSVVEDEDWLLDEDELVVLDPPPPHATPRLRVPRRSRQRMGLSLCPVLRFAAPALRNTPPSASPPDHHRNPRACPVVRAEDVGAGAVTVRVAPLLVATTLHVVLPSALATVQVQVGVLLKPFTGLNTIWLVPLAPRLMLSEAGAAATPKSAALVAKFAASAEASIVPRPVAMS
jgi:hypothetical protein